MRSSTLMALAASLSSANAVYQGFNYGATKSDGSFQTQSDYEALFSTAKNLVGTSGFSSARLYTTIQGGSSTNEPTSAIPAAIAQDTSLLLGIWASGGDNGVQAEIIALKSAIEQYGDAFTKLVAGISVGSEDLYRNSPTGIAANSGYGAEPDSIVNYIHQVRDAIKGTSLSDAPIGHVDTWTAWVNTSNSAVAEAVDWVGIDAYPYFQNSQTNSVESGAGLFNDAFSATQAAVGGKPVWITETGWPVSGKTENLAVPSADNAREYWKAVGCPNFGKVNTWWFTLQDAAPVTPNPSFGIVGSTLSTKPLFDLSCDGASSPHSSSKPAPTASSSSKPEPTSSTGESGGSGGGASHTKVPGSGNSGSTSTGSSSNASATGTNSSPTGSSSPSLPSQGGSCSLTNSSSVGSPTGGSGGAGGNGASSSSFTSPAGNATGTGVKPTGTGAQPTGSNTAPSNPQPTGTGSSSGPASPTNTENPNSASVLSGSIVGVMAAVIIAAF